MKGQISSRDFFLGLVAVAIILYYTQSNEQVRTLSIIAFAIGVIMLLR